MVPITAFTGRLGNQMFQYAYLYAKYGRGEIKDTYLQDPSYFDEFSGEIKAMFKPGIQCIPYVGIHVRRGDYVGNSFYVDLFEDGYYERAMREFPESNFLVFSDDIEWCKQQKVFDGCAFSSGNSELDDLNLMASCTGHIIANSSYSWWAAYLSPNGGKVVAPKKWFTDGVERTKLPDNWTRV